LFPNAKGAHVAWAEPYFYFENYLPLTFDKGLLVLVKNVFCGVSVSLLTIVGITAHVLHNKDRKIPILFILGFVFTGILFFTQHPKYPHYLNYIVAIFATQSFMRLKYLRSVLLFIAFISFAYNGWGHQIKHWENFKYLNPFYKSPVERLAHMTNYDLESLKYDIDLMKKGGLKIRNHEPGALLPSLFDYADLSKIKWE
jgi:hypothetical protein